jgi:hypothetical protein
MMHSDKYIYPWPRACYSNDVKIKRLHKHLVVSVNGAIHSQLTLILLMWRIWRAPNNASKWQVGFNSAFKGLN